MRAAEGHPGARAAVRLAELPLLLRQHLRLGDQHDAALEGRHRHHQGEDRTGTNTISQRFRTLNAQKLRLL